MVQLGKAFIEVRADLSKFPPELRTKLKAAMAEGMKGVDFHEIGDQAERAGGDAADRAGKAFEKEGKKSFRKAGEAGGRQLGGGLMDAITKTLASRAVLLGGVVSGIIAAAFAAAPAALALGASFPAAITGIIALAASLKLAFQGVGGAVKAAFSGNAEKLAAAMEKLSPSARAFVLELKALQPQLHAFQQAVQQTFFTEFGGVVRTLTTKLLPALRSELVLLAGSAGFAGGAISVVLTQPNNVAALSGALHGLVQAFISVFDAAPGLTQAFVTLAAAAAPFVEILAGGLGDALTKFSDGVAAASASGGLAQLFEGGLVVLQQMGELLGNVFGIIGSIFSAVGSSGQGLFSTLAAIVGVLDDFLASAEGADVLSGLMNLFASIGAALTPILKILLPIAGQLIGILANGLAQALTALTPGLTAVAQALGDAIAPILPKITELFTELSPVLSAVGEAIGQVAGGLAPVLAQLAGSVLDVLIETFKAIAPAIIALLPALADLITNALPILIPLIELLGKTMTATMPILGVLLNILVALLVPLLKLIGFLVKAVNAFIEFAVLKPLIALLDFFAKSIAGPSKAINDFTKGVNDFTNGLNAEKIGAFFKSIGSAIANFFTKTLPDALVGIAEFFRSLPLKIATFLAGLPALFRSLIVAAFAAMLEQVGRSIGLVIAAIIILPGKIRDGLADLGAFLLGVFIGALESVRTFVNTKIEEIIAFFVALPGRLFDAGQQFRAFLAEAFINGVQAAKDFIINGFHEAVEFIKGLPGRILAIGPALLEAAKSLGRKIGEGLSSIGNFASDIGSKIVGAIKSGINFVIDSINRGIAQIDDALPIGLPRLPRFERGGIVDSPTLAVLGEKGKREVVLPLEDPARTRQLAEQTGLLAMLRTGATAPVVNITAILDGFGVMAVVRTVVDNAIAEQGAQLAAGPRM